MRPSHEGLRGCSTEGVFAVASQDDSDVLAGVCDWRRAQRVANSEKETRAAWLVFLVQSLGRVQELVQSLPHHNRVASAPFLRHAACPFRQFAFVNTEHDLLLTAVSVQTCLGRQLV